MSPLLAARAIAAGRLGLGVAMMAAPNVAMRAWVGRREAERPAMDLVTRAFGAREVLLGGLALHVAARPGVGPRTIGAMAFCDATDLAVTVARRRDLPRSAVPLIGAMAGGAVAVQAWAARALD